MAFIEMDFASGGGSKEFKKLNVTMTSENTPSGYSVDQSLFYSPYKGWLAFDGKDEQVDNTGWAMSGTQTSGKANQWMSYTFPKKVCVKLMSIIPFYSNQYGKNRTGRYRYEALVDGVWQPISDEFTFGTSDFYRRNDIVNENNIYSNSYRLYVISSESTEGCGCNTLDMYGFE